MKHTVTRDKATAIKRLIALKNINEIKCGQLLLDQRNSLAHGQWMGWLKDNNISYPVALLLISKAQRHNQKARGARYRGYFNGPNTPNN